MFRRKCWRLDHTVRWSEMLTNDLAIHFLLLLSQNGCICTLLTHSYPLIGPFSLYQSAPVICNIHLNHKILNHTSYCLISQLWAIPRINISCCVLSSVRQSTSEVNLLYKLSLASNGPTWTPVRRTGISRPRVLTLGWIFERHIVIG